MTVSFLEWDSNFFNMPVVKIDIDGNEVEDIIQLIADCKKLKYKLLYIFVNSSNTIMRTKAEEIFGTAINEKIVLEKKVFVERSDNVIPNDKYKVVNAGAITVGGEFYSKILDLTIKAGAFSRFKLDEKLDDKQFVEMYRIWVDTLVNDKSYRIIIAKSNEGSIIGFLSYKIIDNGYKIDFLSIDETYKKMGIGKVLLQKMFMGINEEELKYIVTEIHSANTGAYSFFISQGFTFKEAFEIYHVHL
jgi:dTDP-4-amino-4,6-dideoxy-D-galactose acyltransferase